MDIEKQKQIYELIEQSLRILAGKNPQMEEPIIDFISAFHQRQIYELVKRDLYFLNKKPEFAKAIKNEQRYYHSRLVYNNSIYHEQTYYYKQLLPIIANIVKKIGLSNNSISCSQVIENLIFDGYLSSDSSLIPYEIKDNINDLNRFGVLGIDVIRREGECRHFSSIHHAIFHKLHLYNNIFLCYGFFSNNIWSPPLDAKYGFFTGNHVANLLEYNGQYYIHDSYNKEYFYFVNEFIAEQYVETNDKDILYYSPVANKMFNNKSYTQILKQMQSFEESSQKPHMDISELNDILLETNDRFYNSTKLLHDFREEALPYMKKIVSPQIKL